MARYQRHFVALLKEIGTLHQEVSYTAVRLLQLKVPRIDTVHVQGATSVLDAVRAVNNSVFFIVSLRDYSVEQELM